LLRTREQLSAASSRLQEGNGTGTGSSSSGSSSSGSSGSSNEAGTGVDASTGTTATAEAEAEAEADGSLRRSIEKLEVGGWVASLDLLGVEIQGCGCARIDALRCCVSCPCRAL
jgi:hypothetical protein